MGPTGIASLRLLAARLRDVFGADQDFFVGLDSVADFVDVLLEVQRRVELQSLFGQPVDRVFRGDFESLADPPVVCQDEVAVGFFIVATITFGGLSVERTAGKFEQNLHAPRLLDSPARRPILKLPGLFSALGRANARFSPQRLLDASRRAATIGSMTFAQPTRRLSAACSLLAAWLCLATSDSALACKYSVRDVAFVDLNTPRWRLVFPPGSSEGIRRAALVTLESSNVDAEFSETLPPDVREFLKQGEHDLRATAVLVAPDGRMLPVELPTDERFAVETCQPVVKSRLRSELLEELLTAHSVVLVVEGTDNETVERAAKIAWEAAENVQGTMSSLPKAIAEPPLVVQVTRDELHAERSFFWSLGVETDRSASQIAVLYGRMRRLGSIWNVPGLSATELTTVLGYIGQDCECELDRSWMQGTMVPHAWDAEIQADAARALGFDPGSPLVQAEISRILARGPRRGGSNELEASVPADPLLGYSEAPIVPQSESESELAPVVTEDPGAQPMAITAEPIAGNDAQSTTLAIEEPDDATSPLRTVSLTLGGVVLAAIAAAGAVLFLSQRGS